MIYISVRNLSKPQHPYKVFRLVSIPRIGEDVVIEGEHHKVKNVVWDLDSRSVTLIVK